MATQTKDKRRLHGVAVGDVVKIGQPPVPCVVISKHKRQWTAQKHAAKSEQWRFTNLPCVGWVVIQPLPLVNERMM